MDGLLATLKQQREGFVERGEDLARRTKAQSLGVLGRVQTGAKRWQRNLAAERQRLEHEDEPRWFRFVGLRAQVLERADRVLATFVGELRARLIKLRALQLPVGPKPRGKRGKAGNGTRRLVLPIADYETMSAKDIVGEVARLSPAQCKALFEHEKSHKKRKTVLIALESRIPS